MTQIEKEDYIFRKHFTDDDWKRETDIERLLFMVLNWKQIEGKWSEIAEEKMNLVKTCPLSYSQRQLLKSLDI